MKQLLSNLKSLGNNRFFKYGVPFLVFMVGGSFGLQQFTQLRYEFRRGSTFSPEDLDMLEKSGKKMKPRGSVTLESEYEKMLKETDFDNWENIRGPRPYEEPDEKFVQLVGKLKEKNKN